VRYQTKKPVRFSLGDSRVNPLTRESDRIATKSHHRLVNVCRLLFLPAWALQGASCQVQNRWFRAMCLRGL